MQHNLNASIRAFCGLTRRALFGVGGVVALVVCGLAIVLTANIATESVASAVLRIDFVGTNSVRLRAEDYSTNQFGWGPFQTECCLLCSETVVQEALRRLSLRSELLRTAPGQVADSPQAIAWARERLDWGYGPNGLCLSAAGGNGKEMAALVNEVVTVYRERRNELAPMPPGCKSLSITIAKSADANGALDWARMLRFLLGAGMLGFAAGLLFHSKDSRPDRKWLPRFLFWFALTVGLQMVVTTLTVGPAVAGAVLVALLVTCVEGWRALVETLRPPVSAKFLRHAFRAIWVLFAIVTAFMGAVDPSPACGKARVKISVLGAEPNPELSLGYSSRFLASECELIQSSAVTGRVLDQPTREAMHHQYAHQFTTFEAEEFFAHSLRLKPVPNTGLIDIWSWNDQLGTNLASRVARSYQDFWNERAKRNRTPRVIVTVLNTVALPSAQALLNQGRLAFLVMQNLVATLFLLAGVLGVVLLAQKPLSLILIPALAVVYLAALGLTSLVSTLARERYVATSLVRVWPPLELLQSDAGFSEQKAQELIKHESETANSDAVLARAFDILDADADFTSRQREAKQNWSRDLKSSWIQKHVHVSPRSDTFLLAFTAVADNAGDAAEIANATATAYCTTPDPVSATEVETKPAKRELLGQAAPPKFPEPAASALERGLGNVANPLVMLLLGAVIGYAGMLIHRARIARATAPRNQAPEEPVGT